MAACGRTWPKATASAVTFAIHCGWIRSATVYGLWFTRERSKVRSLVRPPCFAVRASHGAASPKKPQIGAFRFRLNRNSGGTERHEQTIRQLVLDYQLRAAPVSAKFVRAMARRFHCRFVRFRLPVSRESRISRGDDFELSTSARRRQSHDRPGSQSNCAGAGQGDGRKGQDGSCRAETILRSRRKPQR